MAAILKYKSGSNWLSYNDVIYPVGAVYIGYTSTSPANLFGGTWTAITGRFPYFNAGTGTGGSNTHTLTTSEMPSHTHGLNAKRAATEATGYGLSTVSNFQNRVIVDNSGTITTQGQLMGSSGSGTAFSIMPAYQTLYAWRRTA